MTGGLERPVGRSRRRWLRRRPDDRGAVLVLVAAALVALLVVAALVLDLSLVRQNRQADKSATDFATAAGIRALDDGSGRPYPWRGICAARDYLVANNDVFAGMTGSFLDGSLSTVFATEPCTQPTLHPFTTACQGGNPATWGVFQGVADGGRVRVTIRSGYLLPDPAFPEDAAAYTGDTTSNGCDQLAVIIEQDEDATFGGAAGATGYTTRIRSVARLVQGNGGNLAAALLLLERNDCRVLTIGGTSGAKVRVEGNGPDPGVIHADSLGNGTDCNPSDVQNGKIFQVDGNPPDPLIIAAVASSGGAPAQITSVALSGTPGVGMNVASSPSPVEVCAETVATDCDATSPVTGAGVAGRELVGRGGVDARYRLPIVQLRDRAATRFAWTTLPPPDPLLAPADQWVELACGETDPTRFTARRIWINCGGGVFNGNGKTFPASVDEVVVNGTIEVNGNANTLTFVDVETLYVKGAVGQASISLTGTGNRILVNPGTSTDVGGDGFVCDDRTAAAPMARTELVVGSGRIVGEGGSGKVLRMCSTTVFMMDDSGTPGCSVPGVDGVAPYDNACGGTIRVAGNNALDWSAPNANTVTAPTAAQLAQFEDLAFWSETQGPPASGPYFSIEGNGGVRLAGIVFAPNADPFRVGGNGAYDIEDAQFIVRRLEVAGNGTLLMKPLPQNAVPIPRLSGFALVR